MVTCPRCGASRGDGDRFCEDCGAPLGRCPSCGEPVTPGKPFCRSCGQQLSDPAPPPPAVLSHADALEISHESIRWAWPLAARAACDLADTATTTDLLAMLDRYRPGQLAPVQRAEAAETAIAEARGIAGRLGCQPLLDRATNMAPARPPAQAA